MTDGIGTTNTPSAQVVKRPSVYQSDSIREVRARAETYPQKASSEERDNLTRLNQILGQDKPLRENAPRGFYLNIKI
ncbi:MAG: hypothetical protein HQ494_00670 [Rhodospirillales bacterium]|nr:hypothetical protein [Rhodospirillales bacterium]